MPADATLTYSNVVSCLEEVADWFTLGTKLGIEHHVLRRIEHDNPRNAERCLQEVVSKWLRMQHPSWEKLIDALKAMEEHRTIQKILEERERLLTEALEEAELLSLEEEEEHQRRAPEYKQWEDTYRKETEKLRTDIERHERALVAGVGAGVGSAAVATSGAGVGSAAVVGAAVLIGLGVGVEVAMLWAVGGIIANNWDKMTQNQREASVNNVCHLVTLAEQMVGKATEKVEKENEMCFKIEKIQSELRVEADKLREINTQFEDHQEVLERYTDSVRGNPKAQLYMQKSNSLLERCNDGLQETRKRMDILADKLSKYKQEARSSIERLEECQQQLKESKESLDKYRKEIQGVIKKLENEISELQTALRVAKKAAVGVGVGVVALGLIGIVGGPAGMGIGAAIGAAVGGAIGGGVGVKEEVDMRNDLERYQQQLNKCQQKLPECADAMRQCDSQLNKLRRILNDFV